MDSAALYVNSFVEITLLRFRCSNGGNFANSNCTECNDNILGTIRGSFLMIIAVETASLSTMFALEEERFKRDC